MELTDPGSSKLNDSAPQVDVDVLRHARVAIRTQRCPDLRIRSGEHLHSEARKAREAGIAATDEDRRRPSDADVFGDLTRHALRVRSAGAERGVGAERERENNADCRATLSRSNCSADGEMTATSSRAR